MLVHAIIKRLYILIEAQRVMFNFTKLIFRNSQHTVLKYIPNIV